MSIQEDGNNLHYADKAFIDFNAMMSNNQRDMLENMNRAHKGELFVLNFLTARNAKVLPSELSMALKASTARISALLGALEKKGQVEREIDKSNRRNILVTITEAGRKRVESEIRERQKGITKVFLEMGEADTAEFIRLLKKFIELAQKYMPCRNKGGLKSG